MGLYIINPGNYFYAIPSSRRRQADRRQQISISNLLWFDGLGWPSPVARALWSGSRNKDRRSRMMQDGRPRSQDNATSSDHRRRRKGIFRRERGSRMSCRLFVRSGDSFLPAYPNVGGHIGQDIDRDLSVMTETPITLGGGGAHLRKGLGSVRDCH